MVVPALNKVDNNLCLIGCVSACSCLDGHLCPLLLTFASCCFLLLLTVYNMPAAFLRPVKNPNVTEWFLGSPFVFPEKKHEECIQ